MCARRRLDRRVWRAGGGGPGYSSWGRDSETTLVLVFLDGSFAIGSRDVSDYCYFWKQYLTWPDVVSCARDEVKSSRDKGDSRVCFGRRY